MGLTLSLAFLLQEGVDEMETDSSNRIEQADPIVTPPSRGPSPALVEPEVLDWDAYLEHPPPRPHGVIQVQLVYGGRSRPIPVPGPARWTA